MPSGIYKDKNAKRSGGHPKGQPCKGAGRKSATDEAIRTAVIDKVWSLILDYIDDKSIPSKEKIKLLAGVAIKTIPSEKKLEIKSSEDEFIVNVIYTDEKIETVEKEEYE